ncbi:MAG: hypothetical protein EON84_13280 [Bradyrhizobiaceae bacterium]|nr:MAG: hypothetical protein EON84_13280 [Bradyrhizobiaceae bacterium]
MAARTKVAKKNPVMDTAGVVQPTPEEIAAAQNLQIVDMPEWYASGAQLVIAGNDAQLIFNKPILLGEVIHGAARMSHTIGLVSQVGMVRMSLATLKDVSVLLAAQVAKREAEFGVIETDYTKQLAQLQASEKKKH